MNISNVSVVIPCHNAAAYLEEALTSVASQTMRPTEVFVIDDSSTDGSADVALAAAAACGLKMKVLSVEAQNAAVARNVGLAESTGEWVAFLDADDTWYPRHIENAVTALSASNDVAYMANHHWLRSNGAVEDIPESLRPKIEASAICLPHARFAELMSLGFHFGHSTVLYRLDRVREIGGFDENQFRRHDIDLWLRVVANKTWSWGSEPAARYRIDTPGSISKNIIETEYFYLRALLRNSTEYAGSAMQSLVETCARRATSLAFVDGTQEQYERVKPLAWPYLPPSFRLAYHLAGVCGPAVRAVVRAKRRAVWAWADCRLGRNSRQVAKGMTCDVGYSKETLLRSAEVPVGAALKQAAPERTRS